jgi:Fe-S-cluster-containing dehydrogenase component/CRP-like cAMP-binding protein
MVAQISVERPQRWKVPFGQPMGDDEVARILSFRPLDAVDPRRFPESLPLAEIIRNDGRPRRFERGDIIVRKGEYGNSVFMILSGRVRVLLSEHDRALPKARPTIRRSWWQALRQAWRTASIPEARDLSAIVGDGPVQLRRGHSEDDVQTFVEDVDRLIRLVETIELAVGQTFGEIAALSRTPRTATVVAVDPTEVLELRWQGLREIRRRDDSFRKYIDRLYHDRSLRSHLAESPLFAHLDPQTLEDVAASTLFETHGDFEWFADFKEMAEQQQRPIAQEPIIAHEGSYLDGLIMVRSGIARVSERLDHGHRTVGYLTHNEVFGLEEILAHWRHQQPLVWRHTLRAVGYVDILRVPTSLVEELVLPNLPANILPSTGYGRRREPASETERDGAGELSQSFLNFLVDDRVVNGTATMLIKEDRCVGCDECVKACAATHDNNPRFVRQGRSCDHLMIANACMHCLDAVCLIGCPTAAIHRNPEDGRVLVDELLCIGCGICAESCPYDNIKMVEIRDRHGAVLVDENTQMPILKATKCDLCADQLGGPACQRACPHDALVRVDWRDRARLQAWIEGP